MSIDHELASNVELLALENLRVEQVLAIQQAGARMFDIFGRPDEETLSDFFTSHAADIKYDCASYQNISVSQKQVEAVIISFSLVATSSDLPSQLTEIFVQRFWRTNKLVGCTTLPQIFMKLHDIQAYYMDSMRIFYLDPRRVGVEEPGYQQVDNFEKEKAGIRRILKNVEELPEGDRQVILSLIEGDTNRYTQESIAQARASFRRVLAGEVSHPSQQEQVKKGRHATLINDRKRMAQLIQEFGGLEQFVTAAVETKLSDEEKLAVFYCLNYFHPEEVYGVFSANEGLGSPTVLEIRLRRALAAIEKVPHQDRKGVLSIADIVQELDNQSTKRRGRPDRFPSPKNINELISSLANRFVALGNPYERIKNPRHRKLLEAILVHRQDTGFNFHMLSNLMQDIIPPRDLYEQLFRVLARLIPDTLLIGENNRIQYRQGIVTRIITAEPTTILQALIASDAPMHMLYDIMRTKSPSGTYVTFDQVRKRYHINGRRIIALVAVLEQNIPIILKYGTESTAVKVLALALGATEDMFPMAQQSQQEQSYVALATFIKNRLGGLLGNAPTDADFQKVSAQLHAPVDFLQRLLILDTQKIGTLLRQRKPNRRSHLV